MASDENTWDPEDNCRLSAPPPPSKTSKLPSPAAAIVKVSAFPALFRVSLPEPPIRLNPEPPPDRLTSIVMPPDPAVKLAVPSFVVAPVATKSAAKLALTVAPVLTTRISSVTKSVMVSVPRSTLKVSAPAPPVN